MFYIIGVVVVVLVIAGFFRTALISRARKRLASASPVRLDRGGRSAFRPTGPMAGWWTILVAARRRVGKDNLSVLAAGVAYQAFFSLFPTLTAADDGAQVLGNETDLGSRMPRTDSDPGPRS
jgi:hypothetical protein